MDKKQRNKIKRGIKKTIHRFIGQEVGCSATYKPESQTWEIWMSVDFEIPAGLNEVNEGMDKDVKRDQVVSYMLSKEQEIVSFMKEQFQATYQPEKNNDFNFTVPFPPMFSTKRDNGVLRLKTKEEKERDKVEFPSLADMIETDDKLLEAGFFEFRGEEGIPEYDGFVLVKYAGLRARYSFTVPHQKVVQEEAVLS
jgi:hypothetical protein